MSTPSLSRGFGARAQPRRRRLLRRDWTVVSAGRFDRPDARLIASIRRLRRLGSVIVGTEAQGRDTTTLLHAFGNWSFVHMHGPAAGDCFVGWDLAVWEHDGEAYTLQLTTMTWRRAPEYGGNLAVSPHALVVPLRARKGKRRRTLVAVHMPLDNTQQRAAAWVDCCRTLVRFALKQEPDVEVELVGDWNKNARIVADAHRVHEHVGKPIGAVSCWVGNIPAHGGTHGPRALLDYVVGKGPWVAQLLADDDSSDHRPMRYARRVRARLRRRRNQN